MAGITAGALARIKATYAAAKHHLGVSATTAAAGLRTRSDAWLNKTLARVLVSPPVGVFICGDWFTAATLQVIATARRHLLVLL